MYIMSIHAFVMTCKYIPNTPLNTHKHTLYSHVNLYTYIHQTNQDIRK